VTVSAIPTKEPPFKKTRALDILAIFMPWDINAPAEPLKLFTAELKAEAILDTVEPKFEPAADAAPATAPAIEEMLI
jgi:hypothetical protein